MVEFQTFFNIKIINNEKFKYKSIVKCIGNYNYYNVIYCNYKKITINLTNFSLSLHNLLTIYNNLQ